MSLESKWRKLRLVPETLLSPPETILIVSHMRSRSSLLAHIVGSSTEVHGYREYHRCYRHAWNLLKLALDARGEAEPPTKARYVLDKVLHNEYSIAPGMLQHPRIRFVLLVRRPGPTIQSILRMGALTGIDWQQDRATAIRYYCERLDVLSRYVETLRERAFFMESDDLVDRTSQTLGDLSAWLELGQPLTPSYKTFPLTGRVFLGDMSRNIMAGRIVATGHAPGESIPAADLRPAHAAYERIVGVTRAVGFP